MRTNEVSPQNNRCLVQNHNLTVDLNNIEIILFTKKNKLELLRASCLLDTLLCFAHQVKYIGVTMHAELNWN